MSDGGRILVVDDVPPNVRLLEAVLAPRGYDVISATDGARALELHDLVCTRSSSVRFSSVSSAACDVIVS